MGVPVLVEGEEWRPVVGFEKFYEVSNHGRIKSLRTGKIRKQTLNNQTGYLMIILSGENFKKTLAVHRVVALAFCEKQDGCDFVNHKDEDKRNNLASNLEWVTKRYNNTYNGKAQKCCKPIIQLTDDYTIISIWPSARKACEALGVEYKNISTVCRGLRPRAGGYRWRFVNG